MSTSPEQITLTHEQREQLARIADATGKPWDEVLNDAIAAYRPEPSVERRNGQESFYEAATRLGLIRLYSRRPGGLKHQPEVFGRLRPT